MKFVKPEHIETINAMATDTLDTAIRNAVTLLNEFSFKNQAKKFRLIEDIRSARKASDVCRIMYYSVLAGEGLSVVMGTGTWQKDYA